MYNIFSISIITSLFYVLMIACSSTTDNQQNLNTSNSNNGIISKPTVMLSLGETRKEKTLPLKFYEWDGTQQLVSIPSGGTEGQALKNKENMCVLQHGNSTEAPIVEGDSAKVIEKAECEWVLYKGDGAMKKYNIGIYKIETNGNSGWTWSSSIKLEGEE
tara:strand:+ start:118 stop:597 length:480 start_codon:yes stop_codon:yes gene_type:complete